LPAARTDRRRQSRLGSVAGAVVEAGVFGWVLSRQLRAGDRGRALLAYELFAALAVAVLVVDAVRLG